MSNQQTNTQGTGLTGFIQNLGNIVGPDGVKTDVTVSLSPSTYIYIALAIFFAVVAVWFVTQILSKTIVK
jgi:hypothetical protein